MPINKVYLADCMDIMRKMPDKSVDLCIVDPPYGIGCDGQKQNIRGKKSDRKYHEFKGWDNDIPSKEYFNELFRISKNQIIWGANYFVKYLNNGHKGWIVWDKGQHGLTMSDCELAYSSFDYPTRVFVQNRCFLLKDISIHPTQKPVALYKWLLKNYAKPGDKIFDSHVGSGSIRIACHDMGFDFEGCEIDKDYWEAQEKRYQQHISQMELFSPEEIQEIIYQGELF
jgi:site-specific DNA-methyltransferase (adenine-specific)